MPRQLDALFVNPSARAHVYQGLGEELSAIEPPTWAGMLACYCRERGFAVDVLDAEALGLSPEETARAVADADPLLTVLVVYGHQPSASTQTMTAAGEVLRQIREAATGTRTALVGGHVSALPERTLREEDVDFVCQGEGPRTVEQLLGVLRGGDLSQLARVEGLWYDAGQGPAFAGPARNVQDLDAAFPRLPWELLPMERYRAHNWHCFGHIDGRQPYASIYTSLGCPYRCTFCCINAPFGGSGIRYHSPAQVVSQLEILVGKYGVRNLKIVDEMFVLNKRHVQGICDGIIERGYDLNIWAYARIDTVKEGLLPAMKRAGFRWLALGIESGSAHVRDGADKSFGSRDIVEVVRTVQDHGIHVIGNYIFGLPDDDLESMQQTVDLALELNCEFANFYSAMAYPGSPLYQRALDQGTALPASWAGYSQHAYDTLPLPTDKVSASEVLEFRDAAFRRYFSAPAYLQMVERKFGSATAEHVRQMAAHELPRGHARQRPPS